MEALAEQIRKQNRQPKNLKQYAHVEKVLSMSEEELEAYRNRPLPEEKDWKREIVEREVPFELFELEEGRRRAAKNEQGQSALSSVDEVKAEKAAQTFMDVGPAKVTLQDIKNAKKYGFYDLDPYKTSEPEKQWVTIPWYKVLWYRLRGIQVESFSNERSKDWRDLYLTQENSESSQPNGKKN